ncbi:DedA family protein [Paenibacillus dauci]|uniref:DedA family protein n=1 Tax=Paenibacillus dauci TaxID=1567106 RepID=UPI000619FA6F|nr:DedA family protein [Paenibacillus dauci]
MEIAAEYISQYGYIAITVLLALGIIGLPIPDETLMLFIGYLSSTGVLSYLLSILFSFIGSVAGMMVSYAIGNKLGFKVVDKYGKWVGLNPKRFDRVQKWFTRYGIWTVLFSYFIPGVRHAAGYIAGISAMPFRKYLLICVIGAAIWTVLFVSIGYIVGLKVVA